MALKKAEDGSFVGLGHISAGWLADKTFKDLSTVDIKFTELYAKVENQPEPATYVEGENLITGQCNLEFTVDTDTNQIHVQVIDMDQSTNDNLVMVAEMTTDLN